MGESPAIGQFHGCFFTSCQIDRGELRVPRAVTFPGMILWDVTTAGAVAVPGNYTVRLTVDGRPVHTRPVMVRRNPRQIHVRRSLLCQS